jgi:hypothetical protein
MKDLKDLKEVAQNIVNYNLYFVAEVRLVLITITNLLILTLFINYT